MPQRSRRHGRIRTTAITSATLAALAATTALTAPTSQAAASAPEAPSAPEARTVPSAPPEGKDWVVSLGDSFISGEAGRWAGNTDANPANFPRVDALGPSAYHDAPGRGGERVEGCHRARSAEIHLGLDGVGSENLACSGARTYSFKNGKGRSKPGLDFSDAAGTPGQARQLADFARKHKVRMVTVSIGGNDFGFAPVIKSCVLAYLSPLPKSCSREPANIARFSAESTRARAADIAGGLRNIRKAMRQAGYEDGQYEVVVQNYPSPIPPASGFRYPSPMGARQALGGCAFTDRDADWAVNTVMPTVSRAVRKGLADSGLPNAHFLDLSGALDGHRLCEKGVGLVEPLRGTVGTWKAPDAADRTEWVNWVRTITAVLPPFQAQEGLHPNYWGQLAMRNCLRQTFAALDAARPAPDSLTCVGGGKGLTERGEPRMRLT
ncbi:hypothetical protein GCM10009801_02290 [Streptomyces albiaxialis]|uniref:SGNH hydrolase-type esterase domain-containing protein n=1 Tax=Streptomyces albiaxialis TaxID=329523 RepID=A0ABN2VGF1_9ACTN